MNQRVPKLVSIQTELKNISLNYEQITDYSSDDSSKSDSIIEIL